MWRHWVFFALRNCNCRLQSELAGPVNLPVKWLWPLTRSAPSSCEHIWHLVAFWNNSSSASVNFIGTTWSSLLPATSRKMYQSHSTLGKPYRALRALHLNTWFDFLYFNATFNNISLLIDSPTPICGSILLWFAACKGRRTPQPVKAMRLFRSKWWLQWSW